MYTCVGNLINRDFRISRIVRERYESTQMADNSALQVTG